MTVLLSRVQRWHCPNCKAEDVTTEPKPHTRFHVCPKLRGLTAPMLPAGVTAKVEVREREDYVGRQPMNITGRDGRPRATMQLDDAGRPVMSVVTTRDEGQDAVVFATTATGRGDN